MTPAVLSEEVKRLIRSGAERLIDDPEPFIDGMMEAITAALEPGAADDAILVDALRRANRSNAMLWARANLSDPGAPVPPDLGPEAEELARYLARRGFDDLAVLAFSAGQTAAWRLWMSLAFELATDQALLHDFLDASARSLFDFVEATLAGVAVLIDRERDKLRSGVHAERLATVSMIVEGQPIGRERAERRLGYSLLGAHTAAVLWSSADDPDLPALRAAAEALAQSAGAERALTVQASSASIWAWVPGAEGPSIPDFVSALDEITDVRAAVGPTLRDMDGFRRSHLDALVAQRELQTLPGDRRSVTYDELQVVALAIHDEERAREFVARTLGALADADPQLREALRVYLREQSNATRAAAVLFMHRNTMLARLAKAEELMPAPLAGRTLEVALALELIHWHP
ncbi:MAG: PucR family transcriptional regulator [Thermoleophilaceae bacterium]|nr:PucR family transcriptional regulator [Thermoleophilaceae bacterium]